MYIDYNEYNKRESINKRAIIAMFILIFMFIIIVLAFVKIVKIDSDKKTIIIESLQQRIDDVNATVIDLRAELNDKEYIIEEMSDDLQSIEVQAAEQSVEYQDDIWSLTKYYENKLAKYDSFLTEDGKFLKEYEENGGEIIDIGSWKCTAYCTEKYAHICGTGTGITASGEQVQAFVSVAINRANVERLPFGTRIYIEGVGTRIIQDTGGGVAKNQFDCAVDTHSNALKWSGAGYHNVWILK